MSLPQVYEWRGRLRPQQGGDAAVCGEGPGREGQQCVPVAGRSRCRGCRDRQVPYEPWSWGRRLEVNTRSTGLFIHTITVSDKLSFTLIWRLIIIISDYGSWANLNCGNFWMQATWGIYWFPHNYHVYQIYYMFTNVCHWLRLEESPCNLVENANFLHTQLFQRWVGPRSLLALPASWALEAGEKGPQLLVCIGFSSCMHFTQDDTKRIYRSGIGRIYTTRRIRVPGVAQTLQSPSTMCHQCREGESGPSVRHFTNFWPSSKT